MSQIKNMLITTDEEKRRIREYYNKSDEDVRKDVDILLEWLHKQPHLPGPFDVVRLESFLLRNKFRIERTKIKLDKYYSYKAMHPKYFENLDAESDSIKRCSKSLIWIPLPKLLPTLERITIYKFIENGSLFYSTHDSMLYLLVFLELSLSHEYALSDRIVIDFEFLTLKHIAKVDPIALTSIFHLYQEAFSGRISFIEIINLAPALDIIITIFKRILSAKIFQKIRVHKDLDSLYKVLPKEYLPVEYGGNQESIFKLQEKGIKEYSYHREFVLETARKVSNEKLRIGKSPYNDLFGIDGTFKVLNLD